MGASKNIGWGNCGGKYKVTQWVSLGAQQIVVVKKSKENFLYGDNKSSEPHPA